MKTLVERQREAQSELQTAERHATVSYPGEYHLARIQNALAALPSPGELQAVVNAAAEHRECASNQKTGEKDD